MADCLDRYGFESSSSESSERSTDNQLSDFGSSDSESDSSDGSDIDVPASDSEDDILTDDSETELEYESENETPGPGETQSSLATDSQGTSVSASSQYWSSDLQPVDIDGFDDSEVSCLWYMCFTANYSLYKDSRITSISLSPGRDTKITITKTAMNHTCSYMFKTSSVSQHTSLYLLLCF